jgi:2-methylcitrate dehydratase PrpD
MSALEQLGAYVASGGDGVSHEALPLHITDTVCAWLTGRCTAEGTALVTLRAAERRNMLADRVSLYCALARLSEIDDIHLASGMTPGGVIVPAALTMAAAFESPEQALGEAMQVGYEAMVRLGLALGGPAILYRGIWPTYFAAPFGVAAVAARLLALNETQTAHALGIALVRASPGVGHQTGAAISRWWAMGRAAGDGVRAALAAQAGLTADLGLLEGEFFRSIYAITPNVAALTGNLGSASVVREVSFKPWCAARQTMAGAQALIELMQEGVSAADATEITAFVPPPYWKMVNHGVVPGDRASHLTSLPHQLALAALEDEARFEVQQTPGAITDARAAFMAKVKVQADESLLAHYPRSWPARLVVKTSAGTKEKLVLHVPGDAQRPFGEREVLAKFQRFLAPRAGERAVLEPVAHAVGDFAANIPGVLRGKPSAAHLFADLERAGVTAIS